MVRRRAHAFGPGLSWLTWIAVASVYALSSDLAIASDPPPLGPDRYGQGDPLNLDRHGYRYHSVFRGWKYPSVDQGCKIHVGVPVREAGIVDEQTSREL